MREGENMYNNCGNSYDSYADYYKSFFGSNYPQMGYGNCACGSGTSCASSPNTCCGGGFSAGAGSFDSRCFIPISTSSLPVTGPIRSTDEYIDEYSGESYRDDYTSEIYGDEYNQYEDPRNYRGDAYEPNIFAFGSAHNASEYEEYSNGMLERIIIPVDSLDASLSVRSHDGTMVVEQAGTYEVHLFVNFSYSEDSYIEWRMDDGRRELPALTASMNTYGNEMRVFDRTSILRLDRGARLRLFALPEQSGSLYIRSNGAAITIKKIAD